MAILDEVLAGLITTVKADLLHAGLTRQRGGLARGVAWAEASGRGHDGAWLELRVHHRARERRLDAGLLAYQPLARGGRTRVLGERTTSYRYEPAEVADQLAEDVSDWLRAFAEAPTSPTGLAHQRRAG